MTHHVILGAGPAGVIAAETIRKHAPNDRITLVGDEAVLRPLLNAAGLSAHPKLAVLHSTEVITMSDGVMPVVVPANRESSCSI